MAERTEILSCQLAEYTIGDDNSVEAHLLLPGGAAPLRCKIWPPKYPSEKGAKDAILAFQSGKFKRGEFYMTTIKFKPAPNSGEYRNIIAMSADPASAPATPPAPSGGAAPGGRRTDATGISIERQVAAKGATDILVAGMPFLHGGEPVDLGGKWGWWANHIIDWIQETPTSPALPVNGGAEATEASVMAEVTTAAMANDATAPPFESLAEAAVFDPESMRERVIEAAGGDRAAIGGIVLEMGFDSFLDMGEAQINDLIQRLEAGPATSSPATPPF